MRGDGRGPYFLERHAVERCGALAVFELGLRVQHAALPAADLDRDLALLRRNAHDRLGTAACPRHGE